MSSGILDLINKSYKAVLNRFSNNHGSLGNLNYYSRIGKVESANNYMAVNQHSGALGKYQIMPSTLKGLGYNISSSKFLKNPSMQENVMRQLTAQNAMIANKRGFNINISDGISNREGKILSGMHYAGPKYLKNLNNSNYMTRIQSNGYPSIQNYQNKVYN